MSSQNVSPNQSFVEQHDDLYNSEINPSDNILWSLTNEKCVGIFNQMVLDLIKLSDLKQKEIINNSQQLSSGSESSTTNSSSTNIPLLDTTNDIGTPKSTDDDDKISKIVSNSSLLKTTSNDLNIQSPNEEDVSNYKFLQENYTDITFKKQNLHNELNDHLMSNNSLQSINESNANNVNSDNNLTVKFSMPDKQSISEFNDNFNHKQNQQFFKKFNLKSLPPISILQYITRLTKYLKFSPSVILSASYYVYCLIKNQDFGKNSILTLTNLNSYRLILTSLRISTKLIEDLNFSSSFFAKIAGIKKKELSKLETFLLFLLDYNLKVDKKVLITHLNNVEDLHNFINSSTIEEE